MKQLNCCNSTASITHQRESPRGLILILDSPAFRISANITAFALSGGRTASFFDGFSNNNDLI
jgi:hypothetical protein